VLSAITSVGPLFWGTFLLRPYVFAFLAVFLVAAMRDLGGRGALVFLAWGWAVAFVAEYASTRIGIPFGMYHYTEATRGVELYVSNVPAFDSLSFPFLAYAAFCLARRALGLARAGVLVRSGAVVFLAGVLMMFLDVVIDPLAVRGDRWFLGRIFYYPSGGVYFGVPLSNFAGWLVVGWVTVAGYLAFLRRDPVGSPDAGIGLYYGVLAFNLAITAWIGEGVLLTAGMLVHLGVFLLLYWVGGRVRVLAGAPRAEPVGPLGGLDADDLSEGRSTG
jgi:putative membrane protein